VEGFSLSATDGEIGRVEDFYFDDDAWVIRYLAVDSGTWLSGRKVLISPSSLGKVDWDGKRIAVKLTKEQIENSPHIDTHKPISRQHEIELYDYYGYPYYWGGPYMWGPVAYPGGFATPPEAVERNTQTEEIRALRETQRAQDQNLRSTREVTNYYVEASDGEIGHIEDFIVDDENWAIRYIVVDTKNWWPGKKVLVSPQWISRVSWKESKAYVDLPREQIKKAPEYEKNMPITRDYEERVYQHYSRSKYWP
jgi:stress response protein YsnF